MGKINVDKVEYDFIHDFRIDGRPAIPLRVTKTESGKYYVQNTNLGLKEITERDLSSNSLIP